MPTCGLCLQPFTVTAVIGGKRRSLDSRRYCLECSPWNQHNTRKLLSPKANRELDTAIRQAVASSFSIMGVVDAIKRAGTGSNYSLVRRKIAELKLDTTHFVSKSALAYQQMSLDPETLFIENSSASRAVIRRWILRESLIPYYCAICTLPPIWRGKQLTLRLDHVNGVRNDHRLSNLRFLCPNCDAQTDTFCGRNKRRVDHELETCTTKVIDALVAQLVEQDSLKVLVEGSIPSGSVL